MEINLKKIKIYDRAFAHADYTTDFQKSKYVTWDRNYHPQAEEPVFYTDSMLAHINGESSNKYALLIEPPSISPSTYLFIKNNYHRYEKVLTYNKELLDEGKNFIFYPHSGCWISPSDQKTYEKTKICSTIVSTKKSTIGHKLRHDIISKYNKNIDVYGRGYSPVKYKISALKDYMFSITIENCKIDYYFTEKLIDCFMTGTIPIYYGCPSISKFFDVNGMIIIDKIDDMKKIIPSLSKELYINKISSIKSNFEKAKKFLIAEDWIYENYNFFLKNKYEKI